MPVFYRHPHVNYRSLSSLGRCVKLPLHCTPGTRLSLIRHLTIRPSHTPTVQTIKPPAESSNNNGLRSYPSPSVYHYTIHPSLHNVCQLFSDLTSFTLKDTLVRHWSDAKLLFGSLKHLRPRKARLEIRMWDLIESVLGRDLVASSSPNVHAEFSTTGAQGFRWRAPQWTPQWLIWDNQAKEMWQGENGRTQMMQRWRDALMKGEELRLPASWIEPPQLSANFTAAAATNQQGLCSLGPANNNSGNGNGINGNGIGNDHNGRTASIGNAYGMSHLPQSHAPHHTHHHTHHRAAYNGVFHLNGTSSSGHNGIPPAISSAPNTQPYLAGTMTNQPGRLTGLLGGGVPGEYLSSAQAIDQQSGLLAAAAAAGISDPRAAGSSSTTEGPVPIIDDSDDDDDMLDEMAFDDRQREAAAAAATAALDWPIDRPFQMPTVPRPPRHDEVLASRSSTAHARGAADAATGRRESVQIPTPLPRGSVLLAARAHGRQDPTIPTNNTTLGESPSNNAGVSTSTATTQSTRAADALERLHDLRMNQEARLTGPHLAWSTSTSGSVGRNEPVFPGLEHESCRNPLRFQEIGEPVVVNQAQSTSIAGPSEHFTTRRLGGNTGGISAVDDNTMRYWPSGHAPATARRFPTLLRNRPPVVPSTHAPNAGSASTPAQGGSIAQIAQDRPDAVSNASISACISSLPVASIFSDTGATPPCPPSLPTPPSSEPLPTYVADPLRSMRTDHILPTEEELAQYGNDWYLHHREPTPWTTRPILRIDPSQTSVPGPRAADTAGRFSMGHPDNDPALTVTYLGMTGHALAHEMREMLLDLLKNHWSPTLQAFAFQALDPLATLIVRDPRLLFWIKLGIPHIRVHLPRSINSLAVFKEGKTRQRDRHRAARRAEQAAAAAAAPAAADGLGTGTGVDAVEPAPVLAGVPTPGAVYVPFAANIGSIPVLANGNTASDSTLQQPLEDDEEERVVGGDGRGGELVHDGTRLFETEVNTLQEMANDEQWHRAGGQLPPQVCRVLAGDRAHDWRDVRVGEWRARSRTTDTNEAGDGRRELIIRPTHLFAE
jgi:hypothetical protein